MFFISTQGKVFFFPRSRVHTNSVYLSYFAIKKLPRKRFILSQFPTNIFDIKKKALIAQSLLNFNKLI